MRTSKALAFHILILFVLALFAYKPLYGQGTFNHPSDCWILNNSGYSRTYTGTNPSLNDLKSEMAALATTYNVQIEIIAAICYRERYTLPVWERQLRSS